MSDARAASAIEAQDLVKTFGSFTAVDHVSFLIPRGEIFGFLGPNGAGKTTTIRILLGLLRPSSGRATVLGFDTARDAKKMQAHAGYMSQLFTLYPDLTAAENLEFYGTVYGLRHQELAVRRDEVLAMAGLVGRQNWLTSSLSGGWRQRLALGCAILHRPELLFLDEPTAGVDPVSRREFWELIYTLARGGTTVFVTTHYMDEAEHCHRVAFIHQGRLAAIGSPSQLKTEQMRGRVLEIACSDPAAAVRVLQRAQHATKPHQPLPIEEVALYGAELHVVSDAEGIQHMIGSLLADAGLEVRYMDWIPPSLEDVFISKVHEIDLAAGQRGYVSEGKSA
jgi:ABC-2 type transport system ATP-binding protein